MLVQVAYCVDELLGKSSDLFIGKNLFLLDERLNRLVARLFKYEEVLGREVLLERLVEGHDVEVTRKLAKDTDLIGASVLHCLVVDVADLDHFWLNLWRVIERAARRQRLDSVDRRRTATTFEVSVPQFVLLEELAHLGHR